MSARAKSTAPNPPSAALFTDPFNDDQVQVVRKMPGVGEAEGAHRLAVRVQAAPDPSQRDAAQSARDAAQSQGDAAPAQWQTLVLYAVPDYAHIRIGKFQPFGGDWPPPKRELLIERASLGMTRAHVGDTVLIETPDGRRHDMRIAGLAYDTSKLSPTFTGGVGFGYITPDTLEWLGEPRTFNQLNIVSAGDALNKAHNADVANQVRDKLEQGGLRVYSVYVPPPAKHPADSRREQLDAVHLVKHRAELHLKHQRGKPRGVLLQPVRRVLGIEKRCVGETRGSSVGFQAARV